MFDGLLRRARRWLGRRQNTGRSARRVALECANSSEPEIVAKALDGMATGDAGRAAALLRVAAERGSVEAKFRLGEIFVNGDMPTQRFPRGEASYRMQRAGVRWLEAAAQAGHGGAQARLASINLVGSDPVMREEGRRLLAAAATGEQTPQVQNPATDHQRRPDSAR